VHEVGIAVLRKVIFIALLLMTYAVVDRWILRGFDTAQEVRDDPKAIAVLLGLLSIAVAMA
jgi:hypothetical protein